MEMAAIQRSLWSPGIPGLPSFGEVSQCAVFFAGWDCNNSWVRFQFSSLFGLARCWCFFFKRFGEGQGGSRHRNGEKNKVQSMTPLYIRPDL